MRTSFRIACLVGSLVVSCGGDDDPAGQRSDGGGSGGRGGSAGGKGSAGLSGAGAASGAAGASGTGGASGAGAASGAGGGSGSDGGGAAGVAGSGGTGGVVATDIIPAGRRIDWTNVGVPGGIPNRPRICATIDAATYGNGSSDASAAINAAIQSCPADQVVYLRAGNVPA